MSYADAYDPNGGVAIVGLAGRFPGARDVRELWRNLVAGVEGIARFSADELDPAGPEETANRRKQGYVRARGILEGIDLFDAAFFGLSPAEVDVIDPQQRLFLEACWEALESAGYAPETCPGPVGVFAGMTNNSYFLGNVRNRADAIERVGSLQAMMGNEKDYLATRVAYKLDLRGPALNIQTACSTSLVAVCQAVQSLLTYQCDMALAGGVSVTLPQKRGYLYEEGAITSPDGRCRAFDAAAAGTVFSNGLGVVVLKRLADALRDRDTVYAVIKGAALNNDGSSKVSFTAPSVDGQAEAIALAQALGGIDPDTISYVECHGTGTALGDPIEVAALTQAFRRGTDGRGFCAIGSLKTSIGHLDAAAGVAGLIKVALALHEGVIPPTLHFRSPNPKLGLEESPFYVNTAPLPWPRGSAPRRAGLSSLGVGGTNAHVVLEEAPTPEPATATRPEQLFVLSARSVAALDAATARLAAHLEAHTETDLADAAFTLQTGRRVFAHRRAVVAASRADAIGRLSTLDPKAVATGAAPPVAPRVSFLFPGQGAQHVDMGRGLYEAEPVFRRQVDECAEVLRPELGLDLRRILYPARGDGDEERAAAQLAETRLTQPALFVIEHALACLWRSWGVEPQAMMGHSLGEYVAACLAGVFTRDDAVRLLARRARLVQQLPGGAMLAVRGTPEELDGRLPPGLSVAAINSPSLTVVSGTVDAMLSFEADLAARGVGCRRLLTSHAFHSAMLDPVLEPFAALFDGLTLKEPGMPWVSSLTGDWIRPEEATDPLYWVRQMREPVRFQQGLGVLLAEPGAILLEVGPAQALSSLARQHPGRGASPVVGSLHAARDASLDAESVLLAAGRLWLAGARIDWNALHGAPRRRVSLPSYPFERKRFWLDVEPAAAPPVPESVSRSEMRDEPTPMAAPETTPPVDRGAALVVRLQTLFADLSGLEAAALEPQTPFLELGLDSLFLTQASGAIQKAFGVKVSFRELLEDLSTIAAIAGRLAEALPPEPVPAPAPMVSAPSSSPSRGATTTAASGSKPLPADVEPSVLERVFNQQLEIMARQLDMLRDGHGPETVEKAAPPPAPAPAAPAAKPAAPAAFGPYRPIAKSATGGLTPEQERALASFVQRYAERTVGSKSFTATHRPRLADPRSVAGFRPIWKEMVYPIVVERSSGSRLWDVDGNEYIDLVNGFGLNLFGHSPDFVTEAVASQLRQGIEIGPQTRLAGEVSERLCAMVGMERAAFCNTGSEAVTAAVRVARTVSGRDKIAMFAGAYHGTFDEVLVRATGSGAALRSVPVAPGIARSMADNILVLDYDKPASLETIAARGDELAAVLVEPVQSRRPELQPREFLHELRRITETSGTALIFDEVVTGFRIHPGGAQAWFDVRADLATYGKVIGGGLPIGVVAGRHEYMDALDGGGWSYGDASVPEVGVTFFAGTFVRHPLALAAARAVLAHLEREGPSLQRELNARTEAFVAALRDRARRRGVPISVTHFASWFYFHLPPELPAGSLFFAYMRHKGVHIWEGRPGFLNTAHTAADLERVLAAFDETLAEMQAAGFLPTSEDASGPSDAPPLPGARLGRDAAGNAAWFVPDPDRPGKYMQVSVTGSGARG